MCDKTINITTGSPKKKTVLLLESLEIAAMPTNVAPTSRPTYKLLMSYGISAMIMRAVVIPSKTGAGPSSILSDMLFFCEWASRMNRNNLPSLRTATKQPLMLDRIIPLQLRLGDPQTRVWFWVAQ